MGLEAIYPVICQNYQPIILADRPRENARNLLLFRACFILPVAVFLVKIQGCRVV
jgi:hypothetical protein